jgi:adenine-specific DNA-methyltransferase
MPPDAIHRRRAAPASPDLAAEHLAALRQIMPGAFTHGRLDLDKLRALMGDAAPDRPERYSFTWAGKRDAVKELQTPGRATLVPAPDLSLEFETTGNVFIEGENLEALKSLHKNYAGRVKMIYIDPPYNTGGDLLYRDNYRDSIETYLKLTGQKDASGNLLTGNPETSGRFHCNWLSMMYPRLFIARQLLKDDGVIFISIDDNEVHHLRLLMNELFGEENYLATFVWKRRSGAMDSVNNVSSDHEYVICYGRDNISLAGEARTFERYENPDNDPRGPWVADNLSAAKPGGNTLYAVTDPKTGCQYMPPKGRYWPYNPQTMMRKIAEGRIIFPASPGGSPMLKRFKSEAKSNFRPVSTWIAPATEKRVAKASDVTVLQSSINTTGTNQIKALFGDKVFTYAKPVSLLRSLVRQGAPNENDIVLDFFAGSCTTAQAVLEQNRQDGRRRRFIMVQLPEPLAQARELADGVILRTIADIGRERIQRVAARLRNQPAGKSDFKAADEDLGFRSYKSGEIFPSRKD